MNESLDMKKQQLEMGLATTAKANCRRRSQQRKKRAQWWFQQMRGLVDSAIDWKPAPDEPREQSCLGLSRSQ